MASVEILEAPGVYSVLDDARKTVRFVLSDLKDDFIEVAIRDNVLSIRTLRSFSIDPMASDYIKIRTA